MASYVTTTDVYNTVANCLLEPYDNGTAPGLSLGIVTEQDFLNLLQVTLLDFVNRTSLVWQVFTTTINFNQSQYLFPENMNEPKVAFVGGQYIDKMQLLDLDEYQYDWRNQYGVPQFWHLDGLPPKTLEVAVNPNYNGASYAIPVGPSATPPFGITNLFNGAAQGQYTGTVTVTGTAVAWISGAQFDTNWAASYYPAPSINLNGSPYPIGTVTSSTAMSLLVPPGDGTYLYTVNIGNDGNLSIVGTTGLSSITLTLGEVIPVIPDAFASVYLAYGVLARIFSNDSECKDLQRAAYCQSRYQEGCQLATAVSGEINAF